MSKITFHSIRAKNFLQIGDDWETFALDKSPFTVIVGKNGTGKSTLLDMITYVLYKKPYRKIKLGQLVNNTNKKKMLVEVAFSVGASTYVVRRGDKPKVFEIYRDKKLIEPDPTIGDMQDYLESNILGQTFKTFCQINVIGKSTYKQFMSLETKDRRSIVEDLLDTNIYSVMKDLATADLKALIGTEGELNHQIALIEGQITNTEQMLAAFNQDRQTDIDRLQQQVDQLITQKDQFVEQLSQLKAEREQLLLKEEQTVPLKHRQALVDKIASLKEQIISINTIVSERTKTINKISSITECPMCLQQVDHNHKEEIISSNKREIDTSTENLSSIKSNLDKFQAKLNELNEIHEQVNIISSQITTKNYEMQNSDRMITDRNNQILELQTKKELPNVPDLDRLKTDLTTVNQQRDQLVDKISKKRSAIKLLGDDGIKAHLVDKYIPKINESINNYLERMDMFVEFTLDSEFNETINAINRDLFTYDSFSEGQKMRIDLAILMTWRYISQIRNSMTTNLFLLDEIADGSLDDDGMKEFMSILMSIADAQNTFIISHKDSTIDLFETSIRAETVGNFSKYTHI